MTPPSYTVKNAATGDVVETERTLLSLPKPQAAATVTDTRGGTKGTGGGSAIRNVPAAQKNPIWNFDCKVRCPNPGCKQPDVGIPSAQRKGISTTTPFGKWLIKETKQFSIGTDQWCCTACYRRMGRTFSALPKHAASPASAAAAQPQPSPAPTPSTSRVPPKLFANLKAGGSRERAIKKFAWQAIDDVLKTFYLSDRGCSSAHADRHNRIYSR